MAALSGIAIVSVTLPTSAMATDDMGRFVFVQSTTAEAVANGPAGRFVPVRVQLVNTSKQVITAYTVSAELTYGTGERVKHEITRDMASSMVNEAIGISSPAEQTFGPGQTTVSTVYVKLADNAAHSVVVTRVSAEVTMIALGDKTAIGSDEAIGRLAAMRTRDAEEAQDLAEALATVEGAVDIPAAVHSLISKASTDTGQEPTSRERAQRRLRAIQTYAVPAAEHPEGLDIYITAWRTRAQVLREHASLQRLGVTAKLEVR
jgi:hypothetical protein